MRRAPLHWPLRSLTPASLVCAVSKLETLAMTASIATLSLSLINQNPELCDAIENPNMIYYRRIAFDNNHFNEIGQVFCNSTSELRNATDHRHCQVRPDRLTKKGCHLTTKWIWTRVSQSRPILSPRPILARWQKIISTSWFEQRDNRDCPQSFHSNESQWKRFITFIPNPINLPHHIRNINHRIEKNERKNILSRYGNGFSHPRITTFKLSLIFNFILKVAQFLSHTQTYKLLHNVKCWNLIRGQTFTFKSKLSQEKVREEEEK